MPGTAKPEQVHADSKPTLEMFTKKIGFTPRTMATFALSPIAFNSWATLLALSALDVKTRDSMGLGVSEVNGCDCGRLHPLPRCRRPRPITATRAMRRLAALGGALRRPAALVPRPNLRRLWLGIKNTAKPKLTILNSTLEARAGSTMSYIDGFVAAVPTANRETYKRRVEQAAMVFKDHGALKVVECWGDDVPEKLTSFPMAVDKKDDETVVFSWIVWPSRQARDDGMKKVIADPRSQPGANPMPFDGKRLIYGGFNVLVEV